MGACCLTRGHSVTVDTRNNHGRERQVSYKALDDLASCLEQQTCHRNQDKIILLASYHFGYAYEGRRAGEQIWAESSLEAFHDLGYTTVLAWGHMDALLVYQAVPDMVQFVIWESFTLRRCIERNATNAEEVERGYEEVHGDWQTGNKGCIQRADFREGIPMWKSFAFYFWFDAQTPLGGQWTLVPHEIEGKGTFNTGERGGGRTNPRLLYREALQAITQGQASQKPRGHPRQVYAVLRRRPQCVLWAVGRCDGECPACRRGRQEGQV